MADVAVVAHAERCLRCGHCVALCPVDAVTHDAYPPGTLVKARAAALPTPAALAALFASRRSCRVYQNEPVPRRVIDELAAAALAAYPSGHNMRPVRVAVVAGAELGRLRAEIIDYYRRLTRYLNNGVVRALYAAVRGRERAAGVFALVGDMARLVAEGDAGRDRLFHGAPALIVLHGPRAAVMPQESIAAAAAQLTLMATVMGLGSCHLGWVTAAAARDRKVRRALGLPAGDDAFAAFVLGYPKYRYRYAIRRPVPEVSWR